jgi:hypothetical protein
MKRLATTIRGVLATAIRGEQRPSSGFKSDRGEAEEEDGTYYKMVAEIIHISR